MSAPARIPTPTTWLASVPLAEFGLLPKTDWAEGLRQTWQPGEAPAAAQLRQFCRAGLAGYSTQRDRPARLPGTSRLSPHLHFGEISPRQIWHSVKTCRRSLSSPTPCGASSRVTCCSIAPTSPGQPMRHQFARFPWRHESETLHRVDLGRTGYPLVDAGMRELWSTGWMHNRVRMVAASFLVKHLLISWREGAAWFWDTLVDADLANNTMGWQWAAGCGADAAPVFSYLQSHAPGRQVRPRRRLHSPLDSRNWQCVSAAHRRSCLRSKISAGRLRGNSRSRVSLKLFLQRLQPLGVFAVDPRQAAQAILRAAPEMLRSPKVPRRSPRKGQTESTGSISRPTPQTAPSPSVKSPKLPRNGPPARNSIASIAVENALPSGPQTPPPRTADPHTYSAVEGAPDLLVPQRRAFPSTSWRRPTAPKTPHPECLLRRGRLPGAPPRSTSDILPLLSPGLPAQDWLRRSAATHKWFPESGQEKNRFCHKWPLRPSPAFTACA